MSRDFSNTAAFSVQVTYLPIVSESSSFLSQRKMKGRSHSLPQFTTNHPLLRKLMYSKFGLIWDRKLALLMPILGPRFSHSVPLEKADNSGSFRISPLSPLDGAEVGFLCSASLTAVWGQYPPLYASSPGQEGTAVGGLALTTLHIHPLCSPPSFPFSSVLCCDVTRNIGIS